MFIMDSHLIVDTLFNHKHLGCFSQKLSFYIFKILEATIRKGERSNSDYKLLTAKQRQLEQSRGLG